MTHRPQGSLVHSYVLFVSMWTCVREGVSLCVGLLAFVVCGSAHMSCVGVQGSELWSWAFIPDRWCCSQALLTLALSAGVCRRRGLSKGWEEKGGEGRGGRGREDVCEGRGERGKERE